MCLWCAEGKLCVSGEGSTKTRQRWCLVVGKVGREKIDSTSEVLLVLEIPGDGREGSMGKTEEKGEIAACLPFTEGGTHATWTYYHENTIALDLLCRRKLGLGLGGRANLEAAFFSSVEKSFWRMSVF